MPTTTGDRKIEIAVTETGLPGEIGPDNRIRESSLRIVRE